jgi:hypothetical protein
LSAVAGASGVRALSRETAKPGGIDADPEVPGERGARAFGAAPDADASADSHATSDSHAAADRHTTADSDAPYDADACACGGFGSMPDDRRYE